MYYPKHHILCFSKYIFQFFVLKIFLKITSKHTLSVFFEYILYVMIFKLENNSNFFYI